jgi:hypothetical protein
LASDSSVLISENSGLVEVFPDGTRKFIQKLNPCIKTDKSKFVIKNEFIGKNAPLANVCWSERSGKSTIKSILKPNPLSYYINPDKPTQSNFNKSDIVRTSFVSNCSHIIEM